jgi:hypothetical protein
MANKRTRFYKRLFALYARTFRRNDELCSFCSLCSLWVRAYAGGAMTLHLGIDIGVQGAIAIVDQSGRKRVVSLTLASKRRLARRGNPPLARHMRLTDGDALSIQGALKAEAYQMDGDTRLSLSVVVYPRRALRHRFFREQAHE